MPHQGAAPTRPAYVSAPLSDTLVISTTKSGNQANNHANSVTHIQFNRLVSATDDIGQLVRNKCSFEFRENTRTTDSVSSIG